MRQETLATYAGRLRVESVALGDFEVSIPAAAKLDREIDVLWVTTKATTLNSALPLASRETVGSATVIPLLNGIDHVALLRARYDHVVAGAIRVESERATAGRIVQRSPFLRVELAGAESVAAELQAAGIDARVREDETSLLWDKLAFLAPIALATSVMNAPLGAVRDDARFQGCQDEALAVARALGATLDENALRMLVENAPADTQSSMQKDLTAGRAPELDAIAGPILRGASTHNIPVPYTEELARLVARASP
jgi:2-dehydropantoate 2-reductase